MHAFVCCVSRARVAELGPIDPVAPSTRRQQTPAPLPASLLLLLLLLLLLTSRSIRKFTASARRQ
jgi:hypothetical protein